MSSDLKFKSQVNLDQLNGLLEFLSQHPELAKGLCRGRRSKYTTLKLWNQCAKILNVFENGAVKDGKGWSKYWCDWKYRVKRRALEQRAAKVNNRPLPEGFSKLTPLEENILNIIDETSLDDVILKTDPLAQREPDLDTTEHHDGRSVNTFTGSSSNCKKRRKSSLELSHFEEASERHLNKPKLNVDQCQDDSDNDSHAFEFLRLEKAKLESSKSIEHSVQTIATQVNRLTDIMEQIKEVLVKNKGKI